jgi:hypothetical protein
MKNPANDARIGAEQHDRRAADRHDDDGNSGQQQHSAAKQLDQLATKRADHRSPPWTVAR